MIIWELGSGHPQSKEQRNKSKKSKNQTKSYTAVTLYNILSCILLSGLYRSPNTKPAMCPFTFLMCPGYVLTSSHLEVGVSVKGEHLISVFLGLAFLNQHNLLPSFSL